MQRYFNITANCRPKEHYMVDLTSRLEQIKQVIDKGQYFTINKGRQYGKTTTLRALESYMSSDYVVISLDFQFLSHESFKNEKSFISAFIGELLFYKAHMTDDIQNDFKNLSQTRTNLTDLFILICKWCSESTLPLVLLIDEVDSASNNQVFLIFWHSLEEAISIVTADQLSNR